MRQTFTFIIIFGLLGFYSCNGQQDNGKAYIQTYAINKIPDEQFFLTLTDEEKKLDSLLGSYDRDVDSLLKKDSIVKKSGLLDKRNFINNRSRIFLTSYTNDKQTQGDSSLIKGLSTPCDCFINKDTIFINMGIGFFGGMGINIQVREKKFQSSFFMYTDDVKPYKASVKDTFTDNINLKSKFQFLILDKEPNFKEGQQLTGYLSLTSDYYYEQSHGETFDRNYVTGKLFFTCKTKKKFLLAR